jgi:hypothetical protein
MPPPALPVTKWAFPTLYFPHLMMQGTTNKELGLNLTIALAIDINDSM